MQYARLGKVLKKLDENKTLALGLYNLTNEMDFRKGYIAFAEAMDRPAVVLLVEEKACFLTVFKIYGIFYPVFGDDDRCFIGGRKVFQGIEALALSHAFKLSDPYVIALKDAPYIYPVLCKHLYKQRENDILSQLDAKR